MERYVRTAQCREDTRGRSEPQHLKVLPGGRSVTRVQGTLLRTGGLFEEGL